MLCHICGELVVDVLRPLYCLEALELVVDILRPLRCLETMELVVDILRPLSCLETMELVVDVLRPLYCLETLELIVDILRALSCLETLEISCGYFEATVLSWNTEFFYPLIWHNIPENLGCCYINQLQWQGEAVSMNCFRPFWVSQHLWTDCT